MLRVHQTTRLFLLQKVFLPGPLRSHHGEMYLLALLLNHKIIPPETKTYLQVHTVLLVRCVCVCIYIYMTERERITSGRIGGVNKPDYLVVIDLFVSLTVKRK
jgi:hypothetical protein